MPCGGLTLVVFQMPTKIALPLPLPSEIFFLYVLSVRFQQINTNISYFPHLPKQVQKEGKQQQTLRKYEEENRNLSIAVEYVITHRFMLWMGKYVSVAAVNSGLLLLSTANHFQFIRCSLAFFLSSDSSRCIFLCWPAQFLLRQDEKRQREKVYGETVCRQKGNQNHRAGRSRVHFSKSSNIH